MMMPRYYACSLSCDRCEEDRDAYDIAAYWFTQVLQSLYNQRSSKDLEENLDELATYFKVVMPKGMLKNERSGSFVLGGEKDVVRSEVVMEPKACDGRPGPNAKPLC